MRIFFQPVRHVVQSEEESKVGEIVGDQNDQNNNESESEKDYRLMQKAAEQCQDVYGVFLRN